jgi:hypothetical protein
MLDRGRSSETNFAFLKFFDLADRNFLEIRYFENFRFSILLKSIRGRLIAGWEGEEGQGGASEVI